VRGSDSRTGELFSHVDLEARVRQNHPLRAIRGIVNGAASEPHCGDRLMAKVPAFAKVFAGRWRIVEMDNWDNDFLDLVEQAHLTFKGQADGEIAFGALKAFLDVRYGARDGSACAEFSWQGHDENDPACGRGWVMLGTAGAPCRPLLHPQRGGVRLRLRA
jgi:hypothetical protein